MNKLNVPVTGDNDDREGTELAQLAALPQYQEAAAKFTRESDFGEVCAYAESAGLRWAALCVAVLYRVRADRMRTC